MKDGWRLHRETWRPTEVPARAVLLFQHGNAESTRTIGVRRLAYACLKRGFILEAYDKYGHGESLMKNDKMFKPKGFQGAQIETVEAHDDHFVELAELAIKKHHLPFAIMGHSGGGMSACMVTDRIIALCEENGVPFTAIYAAPGLGVLQSKAPCGSMAMCHCCAVCCWGCCCCNCCGRPCIPFDGGNYNPNGVLGPENTAKKVNCDQLWIETLPYPKGGVGVTEAAAKMTRLKSGLAYIGSVDEAVPVKHIRQLGELVPTLTVEVKEGMPHDFLNMNKDGDQTSAQVIDHLLSFAEEALKLAQA